MNISFSRTPPREQPLPSRIISAYRVRAETAMPSLYETWDPLLKSVSAHQKPFLFLLVQEMISHLVTPSKLDVATDTHRKIITMWLEHMFTEDDWIVPRKRSGVDGSTVVPSCVQCPNVWTARLLEALLSQQAFQQFKVIYNKQITSSAPYQVTESDSLVKERTMIKEPGGWQIMQGPWTPRPIGLI